MTLEQVQSVSFWLESPGFAIDPEDEPVWAIAPSVSDFPVFAWQTPSTGIHARKQGINTYKATSLPEGIFIEGITAGDKIEVFDLSGVLIGRYNSTSTSKTIPVSRSGIYLIKILSGNDVAALKVMTL
ncbi:MAG TPA: T9SS type A sorting domain-containing protein [Bacteroidaceae bacterium]|nr:T9SS type A sorting domain-containing protein [Bacteroidaceae bacterium]